MTIPSRPYAHPEDQAHVLDLVRAVRPPALLTEYPSLVDLEELLASPAVQANTRLWFDGDTLLACAIVDEFDNLLFDSLPGSPPELSAGILAFGMEVIHVRSGEGLDASCGTTNPDRLAFLLSHGFEMQPEEAWHYIRPLDVPIPAPGLPPGFSIRPIRGEEEAAAAAGLHRAAFGTEYMTTENRLAMMRTSEYDPGMDLLAVAPDGSLAAYCMVSISSRQNQLTGRKDGTTDPVATHPDYQGRGLARALLLAGMTLLKAHGMNTARLGTSSQNVAMQRSAEAAGFRFESKTLFFHKPVEKA